MNDHHDWGVCIGVTIDRGAVVVVSIIFPGKIKAMERTPGPIKRKRIRLDGNRQFINCPTVGCQRAVIVLRKLEPNIIVKQ